MGDAVSSGRQNVVVNSGAVGRHFTVKNVGSFSANNENTMNVQTLKRCLTDRIDGEMDNIVDTLEVRNQNAIFTAIDTIITPKIELAVRSMNASSEQDAASVTANSERSNL